MNRVKIGYSWFGPRGPMWNTELPNVMSFANVSDGALTFTHRYWSDNTHVFFNNRKDLYELYPTFNLDIYEDHGPFIIPFTVSCRMYLHEYFRGSDGILEFAHLSRGVIDKVRDGQGYILIEHGVEAYMYDDAIHSMHAYFEHVHRLPLHKVIYLTGAMNCKEIYEEYCTRHNIPDNKESRLTILSYPSSLTIFEEQLKDEPNYNTETVPEKLLLMWNRRLGAGRNHRASILLHLEKLGLIDRSYVSCPSYNVDVPNLSFSQMINTHYMTSFPGITEETIQNFTNRLPLVLDGVDDINQMCNDEGNVNRPYYQNSLVSLITETNFDQNEVTLTEKSFKPLKEKHPFIIAGVNGALKAMRELGFETFSEFWDEGYDHCQDPQMRVRMIADVLDGISKWDHNQILDFKRRVKPKLEHNFNRLKTIGLDPILTKIHDTVWNQK